MAQAMVNRQRAPTPMYKRARWLAHDDEVDACSGALELLNPHMKNRGIFEATRRRAERLRAEQRGKPHLSGFATTLARVILDQRRETLDPEQSLTEALTGGSGDTVTVRGQTRHVVGYMEGFSVPSRRLLLLRGS